MSDSRKEPGASRGAKQIEKARADVTKGAVRSTTKSPLQIKGTEPTIARASRRRRSTKATIASLGDLELKAIKSAIRADPLTRGPAERFVNLMLEGDPHTIQLVDKLVPAVSKTGSATVLIDQIVTAPELAAYSRFTDLLTKFATENPHGSSASARQAIVLRWTRGVLVGKTKESQRDSIHLIVEPNEIDGLTTLLVALKNHAGHYNNLACIYLLRGRDQEARKAFEKALADNTKDFGTGKEDATHNLAILEKLEHAHLDPFRISFVIQDAT